MKQSEKTESRPGFWFGCYQQPQQYVKQSEKTESKVHKLRLGVGRYVVLGGSNQKRLKGPRSTRTSIDNVRGEGGKQSEKTESFYSIVDLVWFSGGVVGSNQKRLKVADVHPVQDVQRGCYIRSNQKRLKVYHFVPLAAVCSHPGGAEAIRKDWKIKENTGLARLVRGVRYEKQSEKTESKTLVKEIIW